MIGKDASNPDGSRTGELTRVGDHERVRLDVIVDTVGDAVYQLDLQGNFVRVNDIVVESTGYSRKELIGSPASMLLADEDVAKCTAAIRDLLSNDDPSCAVVEINVQTAFGTTIPAEARLALLRKDDRAFGTVGVVRDISARKERETRLAVQRDALERLNRINTVIRDVNRAVVDASTRTEVEQAVCTKLAGARGYAFVWMGVADSMIQKLTPVAMGGGPDDCVALDALVGTEITDLDATALHTGEVIVQTLADEQDRGWLQAARDQGYRSRAAVPIVYEGSTYGVLSVYSESSQAFNSREADVLGELGETIGLAINALERKEALITDQVLELGFQSTELAAPFVEATSQQRGTIRVDRVIPYGDDTTLAYYHISDMDQQEILEAFEQFDVVADARILGQTDTGCRVEARLEGETLVSVFATHGGRVKHIAFEDGMCEIVAEVPYGIDVRRVVDGIQGVYPSVELVAKKAVERERTSPMTLDTAVEEKLSDRQYDALGAAYSAGFFNWPRDSTGEDLATALGVSAPTFHEHLRAAQRKLVATVFDADGTELG